MFFLYRRFQHNLFDAMLESEQLAWQLPNKKSPSFEGLNYAEEGNRTPTRSDPRQILRELRITKIIFIQGFYYIQTTCVTRVL